jgi:RNA polymerase sigma-70 factor (ECF subfamily)
VPYAAPGLRRHPRDLLGHEEIAMSDNQKNQYTYLNPIDDYALARIDYRVRQLWLQFDLSEEDQEDLRNDMVVELLQAMKRFDPTKAKRETFINRVLDRFVLYFMRQRCTQNRRPCDSPLGYEDIAPGFQPCGNDPGEGGMSEQALDDLRLDLEPVISQLPERDQQVARLLMVYSSSEVAKRIGVHRCSMSRIIARIREHFIQAGIDVWIVQRNTSAPAADVEGAPKKDEASND